MSFTLHGIGVSAGIAIGRAHLISHAALEVAHYSVPRPAIDAEVARLDAALAAVAQELSSLRSQIGSAAPAELTAFVDVHALILRDSALTEAPRRLIRERGCNAEWALVQQMEVLVEQFDAVEDAYLRERKADVQQVVERVLKAMAGSPSQLPAATQEEGSIVVAHDLSPAEMMLFKQHHFAGFVTDVGGATSHTAIVARSLQIPAVVALHYARNLIEEGEQLIIDGRAGVLIVASDRAILEEYRLRRSAIRLERQKLRRIRQAPATTIDGTPVELHANIELPQDVAEVRAGGATGIGLYRSEFLFLNRDHLPDEDEQFEAYRSVLQAMDGAPVTIRTLDLGADKSPNGAYRSQTNPALGLRAIRLCLAEPQMFLTQLRAVLRASSFGKLRILVPMLASPAEIDATFALIDQAKAALDMLGEPYDPAIPIGGMVEVPAAALALNFMLRRLDFLSIGTNDLIQYTLAIDRTDDAVAHLYDPLHPAVLWLLAHTIRGANRAKVPVAVCGEMAGDETLTRLLLGLGLRCFSMHPAHLLDVKQQVLRSSVAELAPMAAKMLRLDDPTKMRGLLARMNQTR